MYVVVKNIKDSWPNFEKSNFSGAGKCCVVTEEVTASKEIVQLHFAAKDLDKKDMFGKSDPFMVISRTSPMHSGNNSSLLLFLLLFLYLDYVKGWLY